MSGRHSAIWRARPVSSERCGYRDRRSRADRLDGGGAFGVGFDDDDGKALVHGIPLLVMAGVPSRQAMPVRQCPRRHVKQVLRRVGQKRRPAPNRWAGVPPGGQSLHRTASDHSASRNPPDLPGYSAPRLFRGNRRAWRWFCAAAPPLAGAMPPWPLEPETTRMKLAPLSATLLAALLGTSALAQDSAGRSGSASCIRFRAPWRFRRPR